tara:strand:+ start:182 stop:616 length:435 start_codon:yes stop_codon:yes gene_type:complete
MPETTPELTDKDAIVKEFHFLKEHIGITQRMPPTMHNELSIEVARSHLNQMYLAMHTWLLKVDHHSEYHSVPASWWQHLKADHFPKWYLNRWPVTCREDTTLPHITRHLCPHADVKWSNDVRPHALWMHKEEDDAYEDHLYREE